jgi:hypothetical protein
LRRRWAGSSDPGAPTRGAAGAFSRFMRGSPSVCDGTSSSLTSSRSATRSPRVVFSSATRRVMRNSCGCWGTPQLDWSSPMTCSSVVPSGGAVSTLGGCLAGPLTRSSDDAGELRSAAPLRRRRRLLPGEVLDPAEETPAPPWAVAEAPFEARPLPGSPEAEAGPLRRLRRRLRGWLMTRCPREQPPSPPLERPPTAVRARSSRGPRGERGAPRSRRNRAPPTGTHARPRAWPA